MFFLCVCFALSNVSAYLDDVGVGWGKLRMSSALLYV